MNKQLLAAVTLGLVAMPALSDGMEIPKVVSATMGGNYVLRAQLFTVNTVTDLQVQAFHIADGGVGEPIEGAVVRPKRNNTRAGQKKRVLVRWPGQAVKPGQIAALCMWKQPRIVNETGGSALAQSFRYCKLFKIAE